MAAVPSVPLIGCGKGPQTIQAVSGRLEPEYNIVHGYEDPEKAVAEMPTVLGEHPQVKAVIVGSAFLDNEFEAIRSAADDVKPMAWFRAKAQPDASLKGKELVDSLVARIKGCLDEHIKGGDVQPGLYLY